MSVTPTPPAPIQGPAAWWQFWMPGVEAADEAWIVWKLNELSQGVNVAVTDINAVITWTFANFEAMSGSIAQLISIANTLGLSTNPIIVAAENAANAVLAAIAAFKAQQATISTNIASEVASVYAAVKSLQVAHAQAAAAIAKAGK
jgi:hypothetical protein